MKDTCGKESPAEKDKAVQTQKLTHSPPKLTHKLKTPNHRYSME